MNPSTVDMVVDEDMNMKDLISEETIKGLETIKDFDMGTGDVLLEFVRLGAVPSGLDISKKEIILLIWLVLENQFQRVDQEALRKARTALRSLSVSDDGGDGDRQEDFVDAAEQAFIAGSPNDPLAGISERVRRKTVAHSAKARKHVEELLRGSGITLPFRRLSIADRKALFQQFTRSTVLLQPERFSSASELFEALQTKSKLFEEFVVRERLGGGSYGEVYAVVHKQSGMKYAAKRISLSLNCFEEMKMTLNESRILQSINHENIVHCIDAWLEMKCDPRTPDDSESEPLKFYVLMDYCHQSLHEWIIEYRKVPEFQEMVLIVRQTLAGLRFLHSNQILHLDLNAGNLMWANAQRSLVKIADFGLAIKGDCYPYPTGSVPYAAPDGIFTCKSDMYSMGVTYFEIAENIATLSELTSRLESKNIRTSFPFLNNVLPIVLSRHPNTRPTAEQLQTMLRRVLNPPVRVQYEIEPEDYMLLRPAIPEESEDCQDQE